MRTFIVLFLIAVVTAGCGSDGVKYNTEVSSLSSHVEQPRHTYVILPGNKDVTPDDLQFQEYAIELTRGLQQRGFAPASSTGSPEMIIVLSYGIGDPQTQQYSYAVPVFGQTGVSSTYSSGVITSYGNSATYSGTTTYSPSYGITGYVPVSRQVTRYFRYAVITAYDSQALQQSHKQIELWQTTITSTGSSGDLRRVFPALIASAEPYIATNTGQQIHVSLDEDNKEVVSIKGVANQ